MLLFIVQVLFALLAQLRGQNRDAIFRVRDTKQSTAEARQEIGICQLFATGSEIATSTKSDSRTRRPRKLQFRLLASKQQKLLFALLAQLRGQNRDAIFRVRDTKQSTADSRTRRPRKLQFRLLDASVHSTSSAAEDVAGRFLVRGQNRDAIFRVRDTKQSTAEARQEIDRLHLQLQNLSKGGIGICDYSEYVSSSPREVRLRQVRNRIHVLVGLSRARHQAVNCRSSTRNRPATSSAAELVL
jgi:predicted metal-dependent enzyme (double-stranded beta helix superfamily)